ncbi:hypothetical protein Thiowin_04090 [Thiorhodovibrio winogradskyi]|uniref:Uncharacterized protein n=1 Tax=Thiorhodovibrio winogradskyi TaxID=77007 RepID=A0ABZ0SFB0_9GAMM
MRLVVVEVHGPWKRLQFLSVFRLLTVGWLLLAGLAFACRSKIGMLARLGWGWGFIRSGPEALRVLTGGPQLGGAPLIIDSDAELTLRAPVLWQTIRPSADEAGSA